MVQGDLQRSAAALLDFLDAEQPFPFEHLFCPLVLEAREDLRRTVEPAIYHLLTRQAHAEWERYLLTRLVLAGAKAADWQFDAFRTAKLAFAPEQTQRHQANDTLYRQFVGENGIDRLRKLFTEFPALAELSRTLSKNWIATVTEFLIRLDADHHSFGARFATVDFICPVTTLKAGLSDPHDGGRCVVKFTSENGVSLVYKPRSIASEDHFGSLIDYLNTRWAYPSLKAARCWDRGDYGWMELLENTPCAKRTEVHAFYWRTGVLLGLTHLAGGVDFHRENLIAVGEFPVLVDLEGLWHPQNHVGTEAGSAAGSVLRTGFLPLSDGRFGRIYEQSAICVTAPGQTTRSTWVNVNEDRMCRRPTKRIIGDDQHLPTLHGESCFASGFLHDIQTGFQQIGRELIQDDQHRAFFENWLLALTGCHRRHILRSTSWYRGALECLTSPQYLREEQLSVSSLTQMVVGDKPELGIEFEALAQMDIPHLEQSSQDTIPPNELRYQIEEYLTQLPTIADALRKPPAASG